MLISALTGPRTKLPDDGGWRRATSEHHRSLRSSAFSSFVGGLTEASSELCVLINCRLDAPLSLCVSMTARSNHFSILLPDRGWEPRFSDLCNTTSLVEASIPGEARPAHRADSPLPGFPSLPFFP